MTRRAATAASAAVEHVHVTKLPATVLELTPPHPPRTETPIYRETHHRLVEVEDRPCFVCSVRRSDLLDATRRADPSINRYGATDMESHHWPLERSLMDGVDRDALARDYPSVLQFKTLEEWIDSEYNLIVCCDQCHRLADHALHRALWQDVMATKYARKSADGRSAYQFVATTKDEAAAIAQDEQIVADVEARLAGQQSPDSAPDVATPSPTLASTPAPRKRARTTTSRRAGSQTIPPRKTTDDPLLPKRRRSSAARADTAPSHDTSSAN